VPGTLPNTPTFTALWVDSPTLACVRGSHFPDERRWESRRGILGGANRVAAAGDDSFLTGMVLAHGPSAQQHRPPNQKNKMKHSFAPVTPISPGAEVDSPSTSRPSLTAIDGGPSGNSLDDLARENAALRRRLIELEEFRTLAYKDALTGLWNRRYFDERLAEELDRARRGRGRQLSLMVIDVNDMKRVNDSAGHAQGDHALRTVAAFLRSHLRSHDICCRTGGDEFAVILPEVGTEGAATLSARLRQQLGWESGDGVIAVGLSVGTASLGEDVASGDELVHAADRAMYNDKRRQKERARPRLSV
jgi:diguanylate cyclase (GGDEF)-like protein